MLIFTIKPQGGSYFQDIRSVDTLAGKFGLLAISGIGLEIESVLKWSFIVQLLKLVCFKLRILYSTMKNLGRKVEHKH